MPVAFAIGSVRLLPRSRTLLQVCLTTPLIAAIPLLAAGQEPQNAPDKPLTPVTIAGRVLGPGGGGVEGAHVVLQYHPRGWEPETLTTTAGADGSFSFRGEVEDPGRRANLAATGPGLALDWLCITPRDDVVLELGADPVTFAGAVTEPDGSPIAGARARIICLAREPDARPQAGRFSEDEHLDDFLRNWFFPDAEAFLATTTDAAGGFAIAGLPGYAKVRLEIVMEGRERLHMQEETLPAGTDDFAATLAPEVIISGRVIGNEQPVADLVVGCRAERGGGDYTTTAADGSYRIRGLSAGEYTVRVIPPEGLTAAAVGPLTLQAGQTAEDVDIKLIEGALIEGTLTDAETGGPLAGARVMAWNEGHTGSGTTDAKGAYVVRVPPGRYTVRCGPGDAPVIATRSPDGQFTKVEPSTRPVVVANGETVEGIDFRAWVLGNRTLRGRVVTADGDPLANARVGSTACVEGDEEGLLSRFPASTNADGTFELEIDRPGRHDGWPVLAIHPEQGLAGIALMQADKIPEEPIEITAAHGGHVKGTVIDTDDRPVPDAPLALSIYPAGRGIGFGLAESRTDERGAFTFGPLPQGPKYYVGPMLEFRFLTVEGARQEVFVDPGVDVELEPIVLNLAGRTLRGTVLNTDLDPVADAVVGVSCRDETVTTDAEGRFELTGLPATGTVWIVASHPTEPLAVAEQIDPGWELEPGLVLRETASASGRLVDQDGQPIAEAVLRGYPEFPVVYGDGSATYNIPPWQMQLHRRLQGGRDVGPTTDQDGRWRADGLIRGAQYVFSPQLADGTDLGHMYKFLVEEGGETDAGDLNVTVPAP